MEKKPLPGPERLERGSVADPGCLSRIPDRGFCPSWIQDLGSQISEPGSNNSNKREEWKKICCRTLVCSHKNHKIENYINFELMKKKIWANLQKIIELSTKKFVIKLSIIWGLRSGIQDPGSRENLFRIPVPGV
jgi:hypothetical protein